MNASLTWQNNDIIKKHQKRSATVTAVFLIPCILFRLFHSSFKERTYNFPTQSFKFSFIMIPQFFLTLGLFSESKRSDILSQTIRKSTI